MSLVFSVPAVDGDNQPVDVTCDLHCDWLAFGVVDFDFTNSVTDPIFASLPSVTYKEMGHYHNHTYQSEGFKLFYGVKPNCKNCNVEIELKGKFFVAGDLSALLTNIYERGGSIRISRCDAAIDYYHYVDMHKPEIIRKGSGTQFADLEDYWSGYKYGVSERVVRLYDKAKEQNDFSRGVWWRYEIVMRGDKARDVYGYEFSRITSDDIDNRCADILACRNNSCYDPYFSDIAAKLSCGTIVTTKRKAPEYQQSEDFLFATLSKKIDNFKKKWKKQLPSDFEQRLANFLHLTLDDQPDVEKEPKNPHLLIGGSRSPIQKTPNPPKPASEGLSTPMCHSWDELVVEMAKINKIISQNKSKNKSQGKILSSSNNFLREKNNDYDEMRSVESIEEGQQSWSGLQSSDFGDAWLRENELLS